MATKQEYTTTESAYQDSDDAANSSADNSDGYDGDLRPGIYMLGLSKSYVPSWTAQDAFRELYQNWKDAIINSFELDPQYFKPTVKETPTQIQITIDKQETDESISQQLLGYICFNKKGGTLELTNFKGELGMRHLSLGVSDKRGNDQLAGTHGEGFKLAALVLGRHKHAVRYTSTSFYWNFGFRGRNRSTLYCRLSQIKDTKLQRLKKQHNRQKSHRNYKRGLISNIWEDVTARISKARGDDGIAVTEEEFRSWMKVTLELNSPAPGRVINTANGDLILDERFKGRVYLKGLLIAGHEEIYDYGYNFMHGKINRDRDRLADFNEEKAMLTSIWSDSILKVGGEIADIYFDLLQNRKNSAETTWTSETIAKSPVRIIWQRLRQSKPGAFFYYVDKSSPESSTSTQIDIIRKDFQDDPVPISKALWDMLRRCSLARTPEEEQTHRFANSLTVSPDQNPFSTGVTQALKACLALSPALSFLTICFVEGGGTQSDLTFDADEQLIKIHQKWLDFDEVHKDAFCDILSLPSTMEADQRALLCDHIVEDLFVLMLGKIGASVSFTPSEFDGRIHERNARACLRLMPRLIQASQTEVPGEIEVSWTGNESGLISTLCGDHIQYLVILHKESTCKHRRNDLVYRASGKSMPNFVISHLAMYGSNGSGSSR